MLPGEFPNWSAVNGIYRHWIQSGVWEQIHRGLLEQLRRASGRKSRPTVVFVDSQSVRTAEGGIERGYDGGKKITGCKRHLAVETLCLIVALTVHGVYWQDHEGVCFFIEEAAEDLSALKSCLPTRPTAGTFTAVCAGDIRRGVADGSAVRGSQRVRGIAEALDRGADIPPGLGGIGDTHGTTNGRHKPAKPRPTSPCQPHEQTTRTTPKLISKTHSH